MTTKADQLERQVTYLADALRKVAALADGADKSDIYDGWRALGAIRSTVDIAFENLPAPGLPAPGRPAVLVLDTWAGRTRTPIEVLGSTRKGTRWRVRLLQDDMLPGARLRKAGDVVEVPKDAVVFTDAAEDGAT